MSRHVLILFLLLAGSVSHVRAQEVRVGLSGGVSRASFGGGVEGLDHRTGHALGLTLTYGVSDRIQVETGAMWIEKGAAGTGLAQGRVEPLLAAHVLDYLEIPLLFRASVPTGRSVRPTVVVGPSVAFELGCTSELRRTSNAVYPVSCRVERRAMDWSAVFGGGVVWDAGGALLLLEGRYHRGLTDLEDRTTSFEVENRVFTLITGVSLPLALGN